METITVGILYINLIMYELLIEAYIKLIVAAVSLIVLGAIAYAIYKIITKRRKKK